MWAGICAFESDPFAMVLPTKKLLGVRNPAKKCQKRKQNKNQLQGFLNNVVNGLKSVNVVDSLKSVAKSFKGAHHSVFRVLAEWLELEQVSHQRQALTDKQESTAVVTNTILPPMVGWDLKMQKKTIVLDLDETLVHSSEKPPRFYDFAIEVTMEGETTTYYVLKRPGVDELLTELANKYELVLFTASMKEYADAVLDRIDPHRAIRYRLFRDSCTEISGKFVKDLSLLGRDLKRVIIVDDNPNAYMLHPQNAIPVSSFVDNLDDGELASVIRFCKVTEKYEDLREAIRRYVVPPLSSRSRGQ